ncbi:hypothetical protein BH09PLA1_BH09PLA1_27820 [soil metagenome]
MARVAPVVPAETDILCEKCGYTLSGLPESGNCPECGQPIAASTIEDRREVPRWEQSDSPGAVDFLATTLAVVLHPTRFFRSLTTRGQIAPARRFAGRQWIISSILFGSAAFFHADWYVDLNAANRMPLFVKPVILVAMIVATFYATLGVTRLAAKLTNWEATYRGLRMPLVPVMRGMYYHAAHYLPVGFVALATILGYTQLYDFGFLPASSATTYLYVLCGEVVLGAIYLFQTYWIAMRNMMYANR